MDKDLKDAVLAAFDGDADDKQAATGDADTATDEAAEKAPAGSKAGGAPKKGALGAAASPRRLAAPVAPAGKRVAAAEDSAVSAAAPRSHSASAYVPAPAAPRGSASALLPTLLGVVLVALVLILIVQTLSLKAAVNRQGAQLRDLKGLEAVLKDVKNLARVTVSVYQEPGKRPQKVIAVHELGEDGVLKLSKLSILPLEEP